jgi:hypothetical protein
LWPEKKSSLGILGILHVTCTTVVFHSKLESCAKGK